jgi:hypothetical protein
MSNGLTYSGPINPNPGPGEARIVIYSYIPSLALGIVGLLTFAVIFGINIYYLFAPKRRTAAGNASYRSFHILLIVGSAKEAAGYGTRIASHYKPFVVVTFVVQYFLIVVVSPSFNLIRRPGQVRSGLVWSRFHYRRSYARACQLARLLAGSAPQLPG